MASGFYASLGIWQNIISHYVLVAIPSYAHVPDVQSSPILLTLLASV